MHGEGAWRTNLIVIDLGEFPVEISLICLQMVGIDICVSYVSLTEDSLNLAKKTQSVTKNPVRLTQPIALKSREMDVQEPDKSAESPELNFNLNFDLSIDKEIENYVNCPELTAKNSLKNSSLITKKAGLITQYFKTNSTNVNKEKIISNHISNGISQNSNGISHSKQNKPISRTENRKKIIQNNISNGNSQIYPPKLNKPISSSENIEKNISTHISSGISQNCSKIQNKQILSPQNKKEPISIDFSSGMAENIFNKNSETSNENDDKMTRIYINSVSDITQKCSPRPISENKNKTFISGKNSNYSKQTNVLSIQTAREGYSASRENNKENSLNKTHKGNEYTNCRESEEKSYKDISRIDIIEKNKYYEEMESFGSITTIELIDNSNIGDFLADKRTKTKNDKSKNMFERRNASITNISSQYAPRKDLINKYNGYNSKNSQNNPKHIKYDNRETKITPKRCYAQEGTLHILRDVDEFIMKRKEVAMMAWSQQKRKPPIVGNASNKLRTTID